MHKAHRHSLRLVLAGLVLAHCTAAPAALAQSEARDAEPQDTETQVTPIPQGDAFYCAERRLGTWFYCDVPRSDTTATAPDPVPAVARMEAIARQLDELKARAILEPTSANVTAYVKFQREQLNRASLFADVWSRAVWQNPDLDYTLQRPINTLGKKTWLEGRKSDRAATMASLAARYGVYYFYSSSCGACDVFAPILKSLSDQYALSVLPVSMDGGRSSAFPDFVVNTGQYEKMGLTGNQVPALVLFDTLTHRPVPIGYGVMSADEVMQRIFTLTRVEPGSDY
ncbi:conjugal transfer protein TraF [Novosphingobium olei]|uniref:Conjugal transfer protein TraF n=1 Tax=Novosphingobium olei TaxID=2728851 RepID=A0A7Y0BSQ0_9SPHN|nr:conjugal transfer protein TraF [Novosphingobium olei]NML95895.1 conjugal transfer protein TraF [Novosphingobium olei]